MFLGFTSAVQLIESNVVTPLIERETVELPPALPIIFQLGLGSYDRRPRPRTCDAAAGRRGRYRQMVYIEDVLGDKRLKEPCRQRSNWTLEGAAI